jgi:hypothetical protein
MTKEMDLQSKPKPCKCYHHHRCRRGDRKCFAGRHRALDGLKSLVGSVRMSKWDHEGRGPRSR